MNRIARNPNWVTKIGDPFKYRPYVVIVLVLLSVVSAMPVMQCYGFAAYSGLVSATAV